MSTPFIFVLIALFSFACMGIVHKLGDRLGGKPLPIALYAMLSAGLFSAIAAQLTHKASIHPLPPPILWIAVPFGIATGLSIWLFQEGLRYGHIATSWLLINLSAGVPTILSIVFYHEVLGWRKAAVLMLVLVSLFLLWWDRREAIDKRQPATPVHSEVS